MPNNKNKLRHLNSFQLLLNVWREIGQKRKIQLGFLLFTIILTALTETLSVGMIFPFLSVITSPESNTFSQYLKLLNITDRSESIYFVTVVFIVAILFSGGMRITLLWMQTSISNRIGADFSCNIYRRTLYQNYLAHISRNSSELISGITGKVEVLVHGMIFPVISICSALTILIFIMTTLILMQPLLSLGLFSLFGVIYLVISMSTKSILLENGRIIGSKTTEVLKLLQEAFGGIRDMIIGGTQEAYYDLFVEADHGLRRAHSRNSIIGGTPKFLIESFAFIAIAGVAFYYTIGGDGEAVEAIPLLGLMVLGMQRLLPMLQQIYHGVTLVHGSRRSVEAVLAFLEQPLPTGLGGKQQCMLSFTSGIELKGVAFKYPDGSEYALKDIDLRIKKGECIAFIGKTGCGKSTLVDIIMGLLNPTSGRICIDGVDITESNKSSWQAHIAHVPQAIFLSDASIAENIAFGVPKSMINHDRVHLAAQQSQISDVIESWPDRYDTHVGERGVRLSGGQRQRIGIARALYKNADLLVLDEATSALDIETEKEIIKLINSLSKNLTIIMIAHRLSTLNGCDAIYEMKSGKLRELK